MTNEEIVELVKKNYPDLNILAITMIGSRTFGEPRLDSDYDIRFVYSRPVSDYITIDKAPEQTKQTINDKIDMIGYDAQYFFRQLANNNVLAVEFLRALSYNPIFETEYIFRGIYANLEVTLDKQNIVKKYISFIKSELKKGRYERIETLYSHVIDVSVGNPIGHTLLDNNKFIVHDTMYLSDSEIVENCEKMLEYVNNGDQVKLKEVCEFLLENIMW